MAKPKAPVWLCEAFRDGVDEHYGQRPGENFEGKLPVSAYPGALRLCWLAHFDSKQRDCIGPLERAHLLSRQRIENAMWALLYCPHRGRDTYGLTGSAAEDIILLAAWDARNGKISCEHHHRRFDSHAVSPEAPKIEVPALALPRLFVDFVLDYGISPQAEDRFPGFEAAYPDDR